MLFARVRQRAAHHRGAHAIFRNRLLLLISHAHSLTLVPAPLLNNSVTVRAIGDAVVNRLSFEIQIANSGFKIRPTSGVFALSLIFELSMPVW